MMDIGSGMLLDCNDIANRKPFTDKFNKENRACRLEVSDSLNVTRPNNVCRGDIRELIFWLKALQDLAVPCLVRSLRRW
jgi:hypothetical protein